MTSHGGTDPHPSGTGRKHRSRRPTEAELRAVIEPLAEIERLPTSAGEREAAHRIADLLRTLGATDAAVEEEPAYTSYARPIGTLTALATAAGLLAGRSRLAATAVAAAATLGIADDISYRHQYARRALGGRRRSAHNVVASVGDPDAPRTLVVTAHHDAAPTGAVFDERAARWFATRYPHLIDRVSENPPLWWPVVAGPALIALGAATGAKSLRRAGIGLAALSTAAFTQIGRSRAVPGANDNLSGVAVLVALARTLRAEPVNGVRVLLVSAGAEEALQEGIRGFARRHFPDLDRERTWFLNVDTVGSGNLVLLEAEGPLRMEPYDVPFNNLLSECATRNDIKVLTGLRSRSSTDGVVPNRHGYPTATLVSIDDQKLIPHYHLHTDLPEHVDYDCVADACALAEAAARALAPQPTE
ncbi:peptidase M28 [Embleya scabrispora]|uniref:Peptidase M28 n=1 Tax=Embleya scabrispora TaxID=159449 RepID=A0A1T3P5I9_9ACTN|nr:M28 family peptidase [Embleya scabrispora]OPC84272.1 peptidase M28 [Embleya scabrispora]